MIFNKTPGLADGDTVYISEAGEFTRGGVGITVRTLKDSCFANRSQESIDENIDRLLEAQRDADVKYYEAIIRALQKAGEK